jgi:outer membrane protein assembly factor BamB
VNPTEVRAVGYPDKTVSRYNYETGEMMWASVLEKTLDVRDMHLTDKNVIVRRTGGAKESASDSSEATRFGLYAFSKNDGEINWHIAGVSKKGMTNTVYEENVGWVADGDRIYEFNPQTGEVLKDSLIADGIKASEIQKIGGNKFVIIGFDQIAVVDKANLSTIYAKEMRGSIANYELNDQYLVIKMSRAIPEQENLFIYD